MIFLYIILFLIFLIFLTSFICFYMAFYNKTSEKIRPENELPPGKEYEPYQKQLLSWMNERRSMPYTEITVKSFDGLTLSGKYYETKKGAPIELMFHGYRGSAERDLCGGIQRCFALERNVLIVDQRAHGRSDGNVITFGLKESRDVLSWVNEINARFGTNSKIILCGISMGAATVMLAAGFDLPDNVIGALADCGYTSAKEIICKVIENMRLPSKIIYPFVRLGAIIFGGFDPNKASPEKALKNCKIPIIFIHGENDNFVPCYMSEKNHAAVSSKKRILTVKNAGHGAAFLVAPEQYLETLKDFYDE